MISIVLPDWLNMELKISALTHKMGKHGWLVDKALINKHIQTLDKIIADIEAEVMPDIPEYCVVHEKVLEKNAEGDVVLYHHVTKPYLKSGLPSRQVADRWNVEERNNISSFGPFTRVGFEKINLRAEGQIKRYLLSMGWQPTEWNISKTGKNKGKVTSPKLTEDSYDSITSGVGRKIAQYLKACHRRSQMQGWLEVIKEDGRIESLVNPQAAPTVRMTHKNIVNIPSVEKKAFFAKEMRECFIAKTGYVLVGCDSDADQIRKLCHYMGDDKFTDAVLNGDKDKGTDIHTFNMQLAGLPTRGHAKNFFYGFIFGAGPTKIGKLINKGPEAGKKIINQYMTRLPKLKVLIDGLKEAFKRRGYLIAIDGRRIYPRKEHELLCYLLQAAEAIGMKKAMCHVNYWIGIEGLDANQVCIMHDEYTFEVREDHAGRVAYLCEEAIRQAGRDLGLNVPMDGTAKIGKNWAEIH